MKKLVAVFFNDLGSRPDLAPDFNETAPIGGLANAFYGGLWAYDGWLVSNFHHQTRTGRIYEHSH